MYYMRAFPSGVHLLQTEMSSVRRKVMRERIKKLIKKIKLNKLTELQESLIHDHINVEFEDYYFFNRECRRVVSDMGEVK